MRIREERFRALGARNGLHEPTFGEIHRPFAEWTRLRGMVHEYSRLGRWELVPETGEFYTSAICNRHLGLSADARPTHEGHFETIHSDDHEMIYQMLRQAVEESGEFEAEYRVLHPEGKTRWILSRARVAQPRLCPRPPDRHDARRDREPRVG